MPQPSYTYANARLAALSKRLIDSQTIRRMADGSLADALRTLQDLRYGGSGDMDESNMEQMIATEICGAQEEVRDLSPDPMLTDLFMIRTDIQNLKLFLKARLLGTQDIPFSEGGLYSKEQIAAMVKDMNYRDLPDAIGKRLNALEKQIQIHPDPQRISVALDQAYLDHALKESSKDPVLNHYFRSLADFDNVLTYLRVRAMGGTKEVLDDLLLPAGGITKEKLMESLDLSYEYLNRILSLSVCSHPLLAGLNAMQKTGNIAEIEKARDNYLLSLISSHKYETDSIYPVVGYYLAKKREGQAIRLILTAKRMQLPDTLIMERLVKLYDER